MVEAVIFDLDGVLIDSESVWQDARHALVDGSGGKWKRDAQRTMMGMSSVEWSRYMHEQLGVAIDPADISARVSERVAARYRERLPLIDGAREAVTALAARWPLALASSANRSIIALALELADLAGCFAATVSSEQVARGKPAPDVYLRAAEQLAREPRACAAVEDSSNGLRAAHAAGMSVIAIPNRQFPPDPDALALADEVLDTIAALTPALVESL